jgi:hypothetical protein
MVAPCQLRTVLTSGMELPPLGVDLVVSGFVAARTGAGALPAAVSYRSVALLPSGRSGLSRTLV